MIVKSRHFFLAQCAKFRVDCEELDYLHKQRISLGFLPLDMSMNTQEDSGNFSEFVTTLKRIEEEEAFECTDNHYLPAAKKVKAIRRGASGRKK